MEAKTQKNKGKVTADEPTGYPEEFVDNGIVNYFAKQASIETLLAVRLLNDIKSVNCGDSPVAKNVIEVLDRRLGELRFEDAQSCGANACFLAGAIAGTCG
jgi:hypothetical protein